MKAYSKGWKLLVVSWISVMAVVLFVLNMKVSDRIQTASTITLVFVTWFYAVQAQRLVIEERKNREEEQRHRAAEFGERKITQFIEPLEVKLIDLILTIKDAIAEYRRSTDDMAFKNNIITAKEGFSEFMNYFYGHLYFSTSEFKDRMMTLQEKLDLPGLIITASETRIEAAEKVLSELNSLEKMIFAEEYEIGQHIQGVLGLSRLKKTNEQLT